MLEKLLRALAAERGSARIAAVAAAAVLIAVPGVAVLGQSSAAATFGAGDGAAQELANAAAGTAKMVAAANHGSFEATGLLALHKVALLPLKASSQTAWLSHAAGTRAGFSVTATAEPSGDTYTISRSAAGGLVHTCTVTGRTADGGSCRGGTW
ncbi:MAG TPA: hypothetical protein VE992_03380 [Solirubrobacteraceae bacterium]|nr:hypothetical protein [Solirubrobacteraceae bacterium]